MPAPNRQLKHIERPFKVKTDSIKSDGSFEGYGSVFGELDSYRDIVMPGAFSKSLRVDFQEKERSVPMLWQHDMYNPIGIYPEIREDDRGLWLKGQCNMEVQQGREAHALMKQGALSGLSIGYTTVRYEDDDKQLVRRLHEVALWEVSPVTFPAGDSARVSSVKSIEGFATLSDVEDHLRDAGGFSRKEALALVSRIKAIATQSDSANVDAAVINRVKSILNSLS
ncbi:MAG TPA: HK97 family phage prohead protease [Allosphingosinicella sp.]|jgi:hypothetical protein